MPAYDYRCRACDSTFEVRRGLSDPVTVPTCPVGHTDTTRVFGAVAVGGLAAAGARTPAASPAGGGGGGCCGGGCCG